MTRHSSSLATSAMLVAVLLVTSLALSLPPTAADLTSPATASPASRELTVTDFTPAVFAKPSLVKFYAPWCGHCRALAPIWDDAAHLIHRTHPNVQLVAVDCTAHAQLCSAFQVKAYPTIRLVRPAQTDAELLALGAGEGGELVRRVYAYSGQRTVLAFEQFVSQEALWQAVTPEDYPLALPSPPVPLQMSTHDQRKQAQVAAEDNPSTPAAAAVAHVAAPRDATALMPLAGKVGGGWLGGVGTSASELLYGEWLNVALGVAVLLIVFIGYWLYVAARSLERSSKAV